MTKFEYVKKTKRQIFSYQSLTCSANVFSLADMCLDSLIAICNMLETLSNSKVAITCGVKQATRLCYDQDKIGRRSLFIITVLLVWENQISSIGDKC